MHIEFMQIIKNLLNIKTVKKIYIHVHKISNI